MQVVFVGLKSGYDWYNIVTMISGNKFLPKNLCH